jgi:hypothetical protein
MMDSDPECPVCHAAAPPDGSDVPQPGGTNPNAGLGVMFGLFGGAIGAGLFGLFTSLNSAGSGRARRTAAAPTQGGGALRKLFGFGFLVAGGGLLTLGLVHFWHTWELTHRKAREVSAAELLKVKAPEKAPASWISYTFEESVPVGMAVIRHRLGVGGEVQAPCLLVKAGERWVLTTVAPGFKGNRLVGRLLPQTFPTSKEVAQKLRDGKAPVPVVLPYEFNAIDGCESEHTLRYTGVGIFGFVGLLGLWLGLRLVRGGARPAARAAEPRHDAFAVRPMPHG